jgi:hypothetical protein
MLFKFIHLSWLRTLRIFLVSFVSTIVCLENAPLVSVGAECHPMQFWSTTEIRLSTVDALSAFFFTNEQNQSDAPKDSHHEIGGPLDACCQVYILGYSKQLAVGSKGRS